MGVSFNLSAVMSANAATVGRVTFADVVALRHRGWFD